MTSDTIISTIGIAVNIIGFGFVSRQLRMQALATRGETYTSLCGLSYDILTLITEHPRLYEYVYEGKRLTSETEQGERVQVLICCEMIANYCDNVALQRENIPESIWQRWRTFIKEQVVACPELNRFFRQQEGWYSPDIAEILREVPPVTD